MNWNCTVVQIVLMLDPEVMPFGPRFIKPSLVQLEQSLSLLASWTTQASL